ncbi:MAG: endolytic transglycosylase MltG [Coxiella endosymbiont of Haemaphysalis qinghaiensis]
MTKIMEKLRDNRHPEGLFFPDTYFFTLKDTDFQTLRRAYDRMQIILKKVWHIRSKNLPYKDPYQALIVASFIEKETTLPEERSKIDGVILSRCVKKKILLQVDPTVLYGLRRPYDRLITKDDLVSLVPYNTYQNYGLPPIPIDMPSHRSILDAVNPDLGEGALYYVAREGGSHVFSSTYQAHREAVKKYQRNYEYEKVATIPSWTTPYLSVEEKYGK